MSHLDHSAWPGVVAADRGLRDWCVLLAHRGSVAHGMYVPNTDPNSIDDIDLMAVCVPSREHYLGLQQYGSRGTRELFHDPFDVVSYEARKFVTLLGQGNPNVLSMLWLEEYLALTAAGRLLVAERELFSGRHVYASFIGYARSQLQRMTRCEHRGYMGEKRRRLVEQFGYDTKNAAHLVRLLRMDCEMLQTGELVVRRPDAEELLAIKRGRLSLEEVKALADDLFACCEAAHSRCALPERPDPEAVDALCVRVVATAFEERGESLLP